MDLTPAALLAVAVILVLTGRIVSRAVYKDKADESERWRMAYEAEREARSVSDAQTAELLEVARTTHSLIKAMFSNSELIRKAGEPDVVSKTQN